MKTVLLQTYTDFMGVITSGIIVYSVNVISSEVPRRIDDCKFHNVDDKWNFNRCNHVLEDLGRLKV